VSSIVAGNVHTCVFLASNGGVYCWGANVSGQLGTGNTSNSLLPIQAASSLNNVQSLGGGYAASCALNTSGNIYCWGDNTYGELGNNSLNQSSTPVEVVNASGALTL